MHYQVKLKDGSILVLRFSMYFLNRVSKLAKRGFNEIMEYLMESFTDMEVMANVLAAAKEAEGVANGDYTQYTTIDGFEIMQNIPNVLNDDTIWKAIGSKISECVFPEGLPTQKDAKKKSTAIKK